LLERPALLHVLAEDVAALPIASPELARLRSGLLDALSLVSEGIDPAAEEALMGTGAEGSDTPLEARLIEEHLERSGLGRLAANARVRAREAFRVDPADEDGWVGQWRRMARHLSQLTAEPEELKRAEEALAEDMNEENLRRLEAILERIRRESIESGTG
jgi:DNA primase